MGERIEQPPIERKERGDRESSVDGNLDAAEGKRRERNSLLSTITNSLAPNFHRMLLLERSNEPRIP